MVDVYELWDRETANQIGSYETRDEALAVVREAILSAGVTVVATVALGCEDDDGNTIVIAAGRDLADLALHQHVVTVTSPNS
ncbi:MAG TPA: hypothetical protein VFL82_14755 [Thermomicrobiales bacterium]|jgi:hypothetical protein|nr:hypothetical protein [Thermomicrobiales bacterium]